MRREQYRAQPRKEFLEIFQLLPKSEFWQYIPQKTRTEILAMLDHGPDQQVGHPSDVPGQEG